LRLSRRRQSGCSIRVSAVASSIGGDVAAGGEEADAEAEAVEGTTAQGLLLPDGESAQGDCKAGDGGDGRLRVMHRHQHAERADRQQRRGERSAAAMSR
jgi:hypothetical protein